MEHPSYAPMMLPYGARLPPPGAVPDAYRFEKPERPELSAYQKGWLSHLVVWSGLVCGLCAWSSASALVWRSAGAPIEVDTASNTSLAESEVLLDIGFGLASCPKERWGPMFARSLRAYGGPAAPTVSDLRVHLEALAKDTSQRLPQRCLDWLRPAAILPQAWDMPSREHLKRRTMYFLMFAASAVLLSLATTELFHLALCILPLNCGVKREHKQRLLSEDHTPGAVMRDVAFVAYYLCHHLLLYSLMDFACTGGLMLGSLGVCYEVWAVWLAFILVSDMCCWAAVLAVNAALIVDHPAPATLLSLCPMLSARVDTAKDYAFAATCFAVSRCASVSWQQEAGNILGCLSMLSIFLPVPFLLLSTDRRAELRAEYLPALAAQVRELNTDEAHAGRVVTCLMGLQDLCIKGDDTIWRVQCVAMLVDQASSAKLYTILMEDCLQALLAVAFFAIFGGSPLVVLMLVVPPAKLIGILLLRLSLPAVVQRYPSAAALIKLVHMYGDPNLLMIPQLWYSSPKAMPRALHVAVAMGSEEAVEALLALGADPLLDHSFGGECDAISLAMAPEGECRAFSPALNVVRHSQRSQVAILHLLHKAAAGHPSQHYRNLSIAASKGKGASDRGCFCEV